ncbi:MAG: hypothetical protein AB1351_00545 [Thermoproteota archaeon]
MDIHELTTPTGSRLFKGTNKGVIRVATISLFSLGIFAVGLFAYQQYSAKSSTPNPVPNEQQHSINPEVVPKLMSKDEAVQIAKTETKWEELQIDSYRVESVLVHVKENGYAFLVDEKTMQNTWEIADKMQPDKYYNYYIWKVKLISEEVNRNEGYERESWINAESGEVLLATVDGSVIYEK